MAREYLDSYFPAAMQSLEGAHFHIGKGYVKKAAFDLHQTTEQLYHCVLLVCTFYTPHVHNLGFLRTQAERIDMRLVDAWPRELNAARTPFEKLQEASVKRRSSKHNTITKHRG